MEINVTKNVLTGESTVLSTASVPPEELKYTGLKVYDDGRKCVYAVASQEVCLNLFQSLGKKRIVMNRFIRTVT